MLCHFFLNTQYPYVNVNGLFWGCTTLCSYAYYTNSQFRKHNVLRQLKCAHANTARNVLHLQNKTACRERRGRRGQQESRGMSSILRDKSPALPSTACPWSSRCNWPHRHQLCHQLSLRRTNWNAKTYHCSRYYKVHNHREVRRASLQAWSQTARVKKGFRLKMVYTVTEFLWAQGYLTPTKWRQNSKNL